MAVNTTTWEATLQTKLNDTTLTSKDMLLVGKTLEATTGNIAVSDVNTAGATQVAAINTVATNTFKTVGGTSVLGSGDIATLPSQSGASGKVLKSDGTTATWGTDEEGKVLQVIQTHVTATSSQNLSANTSTNLTNLNATITPSSTGSKILISVNWAGEMNGTNYNTLFGIHRGSTAVGNAPSAGSRNFGIAPIIQGYYTGDSDSTPESAVYQYLDSPSSTSAITYHATIRRADNGEVYSNRTVGDANTADNERLTSSITLMEIGA